MSFEIFSECLELFCFRPSSNITSLNKINHLNKKTILIYIVYLYYNYVQSFQCTLNFIVVFLILTNTFLFKTNENCIIMFRISARKYIGIGKISVYQISAKSNIIIPN